MEKMNYTLLELKDDRYKGRILGYLAMIMLSIYFGRKNFVAYHTIVELLCIIIALIVLSIAINTYRINSNKSLILLGIAYGFVGAFDLMHTLTYKGMGIFGDNTANIPTQLWIVGRYIEHILFTLYSSTE